MIVVDTNIIAYLYISGEKSLQAEQLLSFDSVGMLQFYGEVSSEVCLGARI